MYVLVKWPSEDTWDVYNVRALTDVGTGFRLMCEDNALESLRGALVSVQWKAGEEPAMAELLDCGSEKSMERKRTRFAKRGAGGSGGGKEATGEPPLKSQRVSCNKETTSQCNCSCKQKLEDIQKYVETLEERLKVVENNYGYVSGKFDTTVVQIKNSLSSLVSREIK
ncbi:uncharacterized protein LOC135393228 isoform X2 [Ornithodoros turicata]|uniref:uncharacterized protein LOC135393228 isoform X2 n=1 Tax=Ornithodoros turicata TaxID=34597 RepID=UPI00313899D4